MLKKILYLLLLSGTMHAETPLEHLYSEAMEEPESLIFIPPSGWLAADPAILPPSVKAMVIGKTEKGYPPSINIGLEPFDGSLKSYLKNIKLINEAQNAVWKDLGQITTESGQASLSSVDMTTEWGDVRLLHAIVVKYGTAYIMTCASLKEEFSSNYKDFFQAMRSMKINRNVYEMVGHPEMRAKLTNQVQKLKKELNEVVEAHGTFVAEDFQKKWEPFVEMLSKDFASLGPKWREAMIGKAQKELGILME
jgi:hypothetical protein